MDPLALGLSLQDTALPVLPSERGTSLQHAVGHVAVRWAHT